MRIGILTGGGDVPGLNPCIKSVVRRATELGWEVVGFRRGWAGVMEFNPDDETSAERCLIPLNNDFVRTIDRTGGTILHTSRTNPSQIWPKDLPDFLSHMKPEPGKERVDCTSHVLRVLEHLKLDALVPIGGDGTLSYAAQLHQKGVTAISIPKTMDNDVFGTDYCIGFSTAISRSVDMLTALRTSTGSHERIAFVEVFGRNSGETALISGYLADVDRVLIAEVPFNVERLSELVARDRAENPSNYAMVVVSEGAMVEGGRVVESGKTDPDGRHKLGGIGFLVADEVKAQTGIDVITQRLAYLMRTGAPDSLDRMVAAGYGTMAVQLLAEGKSGFMTAIQDGNYAAVPGDICIQGQKRVDVDALYDKEAYRPRIAKVLDKPMFLY